MKSITHAEFLGRYKIRQKIGQGSFGQVFRVYNCEQKCFMALKKIVLGRNEDPGVFLRQIQIQGFLANPLVLKVTIPRNQIFEFYLYEAHDKYLGHKIEIGIITELGKASLHHLIQDKSCDFPIEEIIYFAYQFVKLFAFFQDQHIVHRDIKPQNFVQTGSGLECKLIDFGLCSHVNDIQGVAGSFCYLSPKLKKMHTNKELRGKIQSNPYKNDVYSFGLTLYQLITRKNPQKRNSESTKKFPNDVYRCTQNEKLASIVQHMLEYQEDSRPDFHKLYEIFTQNWTFYQENLEIDEKIHGSISQKSLDDNKTKLTHSRTQNSKKQQEKTIRRRNQSRDYVPTQKNQSFQPQFYHDKWVNYERKSIYYVDRQFQQINKKENSEFKKGETQHSQQHGQQNQGNRQHTAKTKLQILHQERNLNQSQYHQTEMMSHHNGEQNFILQSEQGGEHAIQLEKMDYILPSSVKVTSIVLVDKFIIFGCKDGSIGVINILNTYQNIIYKIVGPQHLHHQAVTAIEKDSFQNLWTVSVDGKLLMWNRLKLLQHLEDESSYKLQNGFDEKKVMKKGFVGVSFGVNKAISVPADLQKAEVSSMLCHSEKNYALGYSDGTVFVLWDQYQITYNAHGRTITAFTVYENHLLSSSLDGTIRILNLNNPDLKDSYFCCKMEIQNFAVQGSLNQPKFTIVTTDGRGYAVNSWELTEQQEGSVLQDDSPVTSVFFANEFVFTLNEKGSIQRNGGSIQQCQGKGWRCMFWDGLTSIVVGSEQSRICLIKSQ